jgi:Uma2 family endonuclease
MTALLKPTVALATLSDLLDHLGGIAPARVRLHPALGTATEADVLSVHDQEQCLCELVDGVLVEKAMGFRESFLALALGAALRNFVRPRRLGLVTGPDGTIRLAAGLVRIPDVAFIAWDRLPNHRVPTDPIPTLVPNLAVEVLSAGNTAGEMARKCHEYFMAGVELVWLVDPAMRTVTVYTAPEQATVLHAQATLEGGAVLPGFTLYLRDFFAELDESNNG